MENENILENTQVSEQEQVQVPVAEPAATVEQTTPVAEAVVPVVAAAPEAPKKGKKVFKIIRNVVAAVLAVALIAACCCVTAWYVDKKWAQRQNNAEYELTRLNQLIQQLEKEIQDNSYTGNGNSISGSNGAEDGLTPAQVYAKNYKSVVAVTSVIRTSNFGQSSYSTSTGSGFIITEDGYVVTNYHVVADGTNVTVTLYTGAELKAQVVGFDAANDVAVLKAEGENLQKVELGSSDDLIVGDQVVAIGYPLSEMASASLTVGYISGKDRTVNTDGTNINMLQTDAAINSGNSGGPLFNMKGEVVGITSAKMSGTTSSGAIIEGTGYAIPIDDVAKKIRDLSQYGYITGAYLGVSVQDVDKTDADRFGLPMGAYVVEVSPGFCAEAAGVKAKDIIVAVGEYNVGSINGLTRALENFKAGDATTITVWRSGLYQTFNITLNERLQS